LIINENKENITTNEESLLSIPNKANAKSISDKKIQFTEEDNKEVVYDNQKCN